MKKPVVVILLLVATGLGLTAPARAQDKAKPVEVSTKHQKQEAARKQREESRAAREQAARERRAERERKQAERAHRLAEPRVEFRMTSVETAFRGLSVSAMLTVKNAPLDAFGAASAELEIVDANNTTLALEECTAAPGLPTKIETDAYKLSCKISEKGTYSGSLAVLGLSFGTYSGSGHYTGGPANLSLPVGLGMISMEQSPAPQADLDCQYSDWSPWEACNFFGNQTRTRSILREAEPGGLACDSSQLFEIRQC